MNSPGKYFCVAVCIILTLQQQPYAQSITLYCFPPPHKINWNSPHTLLTSTFRNYLSKKTHGALRPLGHMVVELKKGSSYMLTGMTAKYNSELRKNIFKHKDGLGILFNVIEGQLEETSAIKTELDSRAKSGKVAFITYKISDSAYEYLKLYLQAFKERGYDKMYNGLNEPRQGLGSGCSAFAVSFLELINALVPEYNKDWTVSVNVPDKLIGGVPGSEKISLLKVFFSFGWAKKSEPSTPLVLYDPYLMYHWIQLKWKEQNAGTGMYSLKKMDNAKGLEVQCKDCQPQTPMFKAQTVSLSQ